MSKRELKNLAEQGSSGCVQHRLRSGKSRGSLSVMEGGNQTETVDTADPHVSDDVQELREKLQMAQEELEIVRARLAQQLAAAGEAAALAEQLKRAQQTAEAAAVEGAEQRRRAEDAESQLDRLARESEELQRRVFETEETARAEVEATRMRLELEGLRQLEEVRRQFDKERDRYQREHDQDATLIADLRTLLQDGTTRRPTGGPERELQAPGESVAASAPLHGGVEHCETTEGGWVGDRSVSFTVGGTPGVLGPPVSQAAHTVDTSIGTGGPVSLVGVGSSVASATDNNVADSTERSSSCSSGEQGGIGDGVLIQQLTQLVQTQTAMVAAQTRAMSAQSLPPIPTYSGEGEEGFERWIDQFEERARLAGWTDDLCSYHLKMRLSKNAFQTYRLLPEDVKASYSATVRALKSKFKPIDIEELRGMEFHQLVEKGQSIEQLGLELQKLAKRAFPCLSGKDLDRLLKGRFFQALLPKWQRRLGAPKVEESFDELFSRARVSECHEQQYSDLAEERKSKDKTRKTDTDSSRDKGSGSSSTTSTGVLPSSDEGAGDKPPRKQGQGIQCRACGQYGHIARNCLQRRRQGPEAPGRQENINPKPQDSLQVHSVSDCTDQELEQELSRRRLDKEQKLADGTSPVVNVVTGAIASVYQVDVSLEGLAVSAIVDTGSQSTIISRALLHKVFAHIRNSGNVPPKLQAPCTKFKGKGGNPILITAQVPLTLSLDGKEASVPVFVQPDSEQECLLGSNVLPTLGVSVVRSNVHPVTITPRPLDRVEVASVNLIQATTLPGLNGCFARAKVGVSMPENACHLFEPNHEALNQSGVTAFESVITLDRDGHAMVPLHNYQCTCVTLHKGSPLGLVRQCEVLHEGQPCFPGPCCPISGTVLEVVSEDAGRYEQLVQALEIPTNKLEHDQVTALMGLIQEYSDVFALTDLELGCTDIVRHSIDTGDNKPIKQHPYRTAIARRDTTRQMVEQMQRQGIVQPSRSPWASPVVLVPKKDGSLRFCVDYRRLNAITQKDVFPLPRVDDILDTLAGTQFFTSLDLASGYWQIELDDDARAKSAFTTYNGLFEFVRMPFGLCNAPATFQRVMQVVLAGLESEGVFVYLDDILIASRSFDKHLVQLREVFERLRAAGLRLKPKKCLFLRNEVPYLGHIISSQGVMPDPAKISKVQSFPVPRDITGVRQFIGLASYYRRFVPKFADVAAPLRALTKKDITFNWTIACQQAFDELKGLLVSAPVLAYPRFGLGAEFVLETDASGVGLGAVLSQTQKDNQLHPIAYASRSLDHSERNYSITELETLAVVWAAQYFRPYLLGHHTIVYTDHSACVSVLGTARPSGKIARWALTIQELNLTFRRRAGKLNSNADALSRNPTSTCGGECCCGLDACSSCDGACCVDTDGSRDSVSRTDLGFEDVCSGCGVYNGCGCNFGSSGAPDTCCTRGGVGISGDSQLCCRCSREDVEVELFSGDNVLYVAENDQEGVVKDDNEIKNDDYLISCESKQIHKLQMEDIDLQPHLKYHTHGVLPEDPKLAKKIVMESQHYEIIDGVLHHESPNYPGHWCIVVPQQLRPQLLHEAHAGCFSGHFSERKVYDKIRRNYWWYGLRRDIRKFCRACLNCVSRRGPGHASRPPLVPIPVKGAFHRVAVDVLQLPLTSSGNKYVIVFMDYLTKWVEAFPTADQQATTVAELMIEHIVCRHGVPEELLSDRGTNFLSDIMMKLCSLLGIKKINTSGYHPQTDGLVEKFNSTLQAMIAKSGDVNGMEWDKRLPLLLLAYRSVVQDSTKESPFFLLYGRDPRLPSGADLDAALPTYPVDAKDYRAELFVTVKKARELALDSIRKSQERQQKFYDRKSTSTKFQVGDRVMVFMPSEVTGKNRKLARPYHGPYRVVSVTPTNAKVQLIEFPDEPTIFVAIDRMRRCYTEQDDRCWLGPRKKPPRRKNKPSTSASTVEPVEASPRQGPVTRSMTRKRVTWNSGDEVIPSS